MVERDKSEKFAEAFFCFCSGAFTWNIYLHQGFWALILLGILIGVYVLWAIRGIKKAKKYRE
jgi:hypothetical protein